MKKIALGMSGGVDSSVTAYLLKKQGYEVIGIYLQMIEKKDAEKAINDGKRVAEQLGIEFKVIDIRDKFNEKVINYFTDSYLSGITPNPCVVCNREIKFKVFFEVVENLGVDFIATGHYVKVEKNPDNGFYYLKKAEDQKKDQTYFLYYLTQEVLKKVIFPLGEYQKEDIKKMAEEVGLHVAQKSESQEICFIPDNDYKKYLKAAVGEKSFKSGSIIDTEGNKVGEHLGLPFYTIGQRKGLGISLDYPSYVIGSDLEKNILYVGRNEDLFSNSLIAGEYNVLDGTSFDEEIEYDIKTRYSTKTSKGKIKILSEQRIEVTFSEPQRAVTPGQSVVVYKNDVLIGGGVIVNSI